MITNNKWLLVVFILMGVGVIIFFAPKIISDFYVSRGRATGDLGYYDRALTFNPQNSEAYLYRGMGRWSMGQWNRVIDDTTNAIRLNPNSAKAYTFRGEAYLRSGNLSAAYDDFSQSIQLDSSDELAFVAYLGRATVNEELGNLPEAINDLSQVLALRQVEDETTIQIREHIKELSDQIQ